MTRVVVQVISNTHEGTWEVDVVHTDPDTLVETRYPVAGANSPGPWLPQVLDTLAPEDFEDLTVEFIVDGDTYTFPSEFVNRSELRTRWHRYTITYDWITPDADAVIAVVPSSHTLPDGDYDAVVRPGAAFAQLRFREAQWGISVPFGGPGAPWADSAAWGCSWQHANQGDDGGHYYNTDHSSIVWDGAFACAPVGTGEVAVSTQTGADVGWSVGTGSGAFSSSMHATTQSISQRVDLDAIVTALGPSGGLPEPDPPEGHTLEWEDASCTVNAVAVSGSEPTANVGSGEGIQVLSLPGGGYGPKAGDDTKWIVGSYAGTELTSYAGGDGSWSDVTSELGTSGSHTLMWTPDCIPANSQPATPSTAVTTDSELRAGLVTALRLDVTPSRYRFVPTDQTLIFDLKVGDSAIRQWPREDALGWSSATRRFPLPKSSRRVGGIQ